MSKEELIFKRFFKTDPNDVEIIHASTKKVKFSELIKIEFKINPEQLLSLFSFYDTKIKDINSLSNLNKVSRLFLNDTEISSITPLKDLKDLQSLFLSNTKITSIKDLKNLPYLRYISTYETGISEQEVLEFKRSKPKCWVEDKKPITQF